MMYETAYYEGKIRHNELLESAARHRMIHKKTKPNPVLCGICIFLGNALVEWGESLRSVQNSYKLHRV